MSGWLYCDCTPTPLLFIMKHVLKQNLQVGSKRTSTSAEKKNKKEQEKKLTVYRWKANQEEAGSQRKHGGATDGTREEPLIFSLLCFKERHGGKVYLLRKKKQTVLERLQSFSVNEMRVCGRLPAFCRIVTHRTCARHE